MTAEGRTIPSATPALPTQRRCRCKLLQKHSRALFLRFPSISSALFPCFSGSASLPHSACLLPWIPAPVVRGSSDEHDEAQEINWMIMGESDDERYITSPRKKKKKVTCEERTEDARAGSDVSKTVAVALHFRTRSYQNVPSARKPEAVARSLLKSYF